ncbi:hypothetical protein APR11_003189 [Nocardia amikacinitolerans]|uniref:hypothetical protein n=1 Tax=Nocardia amikacinitolerans TaxID=756689 RepID=UPI0020A461A7|nr:hypothetical protein [Nocardia amikacinitolerans]MCP2296757.1 hypothetical protein [Nocardia amikacinitolerans]
MRKPAEGAARLRGAFVGSASGAVGIAAHALGGGVVSPERPSLALLIGACAAVGVLVGSLRRRAGFVELMGLLAIGQAVGHTALTMSPGHHHGSHATAVMLAAHLAAIPVGALLIRSAEAALAKAASSVRDVVRVLGPAPAPASAPIIRIAPRAAACPRRLLLSSGIGTRGPPAFR